jgi:hypothetical protein
MENQWTLLRGLEDKIVYLQNFSSPLRGEDQRWGEMKYGYQQPNLAKRLKESFCQIVKK